MTSTTRHPLRQSLATIAAATVLAACAEPSPVAPDVRSASPSARTLLTSAQTDEATPGRFPDLGICQQLRVPEGSKLAFQVLGEGVQIYRWTGTSWRFDRPKADLFADGEANGLVGTHFGGPTWLTVSGSSVVGTVTKSCTADSSAIDWLLLDAAAAGAGVFEQTKFIQRVNTVGGIAPTRPGLVVGEEVSIPYTADYLFYRAPSAT